MNEELTSKLNEQLVDLLNRANSGFDQSVDFLSAEIPEVISEILYWYAAYNALLALFGVILLIAYAYAEYRIAKHGIEKKWGSDTWILEYGFIGSIARISILLVAFVGLINLTWLQILIAPRLFLIEYAAKLAS